ncbi:flagellar basal-body rod protein FlgF [Rhodospirillaceae bacterium KN72]|uniref:Flagellar basal-body rod protein FlgF n=1 Tax=Pacificispira spongiicola TaxID=2729598 RepID=A0A7Y0HHW1_9PROT|nr:flagellar basal-body rod protein FlgF [Pacificispira spongiicola]NMM46312.1 flagellar basal-body rod protein FlgF [Pacificispira spongiicola]
MENTTYIGLSRQIGLRRAMDVVAHNIANANTPAYKAERLVFQEYLAKPEHSEKLSFVQDVGMARDQSIGPLTTTGNDFDVAITEEAGFFVVDTPLGERYTRHGRFQLSADGQLVTGEGYPVQGAAGAINIPTDEGRISIAADGTISNENGVLGKLQVVDFEDPQQLRKAANGLFSAPDGVEPNDVATPSLAQGMIEDSNVQPILELTRMMDINRTHESVTKFLQREDERIKDMVEKLGKPAA